MQAFDFTLLERLDETVLRREVDDLGVVVAEVEAFEEVVFNNVFEISSVQFPLEEKGKEATHPSYSCPQQPHSAAPTSY